MAIYRVEYYSKTLSKNTKFIALIPNDTSAKDKKNIYQIMKEERKHFIFLMDTEVMRILI